MKRIILSLAVIAVVATAAVSATRAFFSDTETSTGNTFTAGVLDLNGPGIESFDLGDIPPMSPGDKTDEVVVTIKNDGTIPLAWFGDLVVGDSNLKKAIYIDYAKMEFLSTTTGTWEPADNFITDGVGSGLYPSWYNSLASSSEFGVNTLDVFDGNNGMGTTPYEFMGALNPGYSYRLTLKFGFAPLAGNEFQGNVEGNDPLSVNFQVDAVQLNVEALNSFHPSFGTNHFTWLNDQIAKQD